MSAVLSADVEPIPCSDRGDVDARERITALMRYLEIGQLGEIAHRSERGR